MVKKLLTPKQAKIYKDLRDIGATPKQANQWVSNRITLDGKMKKR